MKESLKDKINNLRLRLVVRSQQLELNILHYAEAKNHQDAAINQIKKEQIDMFIQSIDDILK